MMKRGQEEGENLSDLPNKVIKLDSLDVDDGNLRKVHTNFFKNIYLGLFLLLDVIFKLRGEI